MPRVIGPRFRLVTTECFYLKNTHGIWLHMATIQYNTKEFMVFKNVTNQETYIEEISLSGQLEFIKDEKLFIDLWYFVLSHGILDPKVDPIWNGVD